MLTTQTQPPSTDVEQSRDDRYCKDKHEKETVTLKMITVPCLTARRLGAELQLREAAGEQRRR